MSWNLIGFDRFEVNWLGSGTTTLDLPQPIGEILCDEKVVG